MKSNSKFKKIGAVVAIGLLMSLAVMPIIDAACIPQVDGTDYTLVTYGDPSVNQYRFDNWLTTTPTNFLSYSINNIVGTTQSISVRYREDGKDWTDTKVLSLTENKIYNISLNLVQEVNNKYRLEIYIDNELQSYYIPLPEGLTGDKLFIGDIATSEYSNIRTCDTLIEPVCDINNLGLCTTQEECIAITGAYWINNACTNVCTPNWSVGAWSSCLDGQKTRIVTDLNACGIDTDKPIAIMTCSSSSSSSSSHHHHNDDDDDDVPIINDTTVDPIINDTNDTIIIPTPIPEVKPSFWQKNWMWLSAAGLVVVGGITTLFMLNSKKKKTKKK
jgi:hypothetical protein